MGRCPGASRPVKQSKDTARVQQPGAERLGEFGPKGGGPLLQGLLQPDGERRVWEVYRVTERFKIPICSSGGDNGLHET